MHQKPVTHSTKISFLAMNSCSWLFLTKQHFREAPGSRTCCQSPAPQQVFCSTSRNCSPTESHGGSGAEHCGQRAMPRPRMRILAKQHKPPTATRGSLNREIFLPCISSRLVFVKNKSFATLRDLCFYLCSFSTGIGTEPLSAPSWLNRTPSMICINAAFTSLKTLMNFCHS